MAEEILLKTRLNRDLLPSSEKNHEVICRLDIEPASSYRSRHSYTACDLCLVIDGSGSMNEPFSGGSKMTKREGVMAAARKVVEMLQPEDTISIVEYDSTAHCLAKGLKTSDKTKIMASIDELSRFDGNTNFEAGLTTAYSILKEGKNPSRRLIFLTDGNDNMSNPGNINKKIQELASDNVVVDCIGAGSDFNFSYMRSLSAPSNGRTFLLSSPDEAAGRFEELLVNAQRIIAGKVFLTVLFPAGIRDIEAYQWLPEMRYYKDLKPAPDGTARLEVNVQTLRQDQRNVFFFRFCIDPEPGRLYRLGAQIRLDYDLPHEKKSAQQNNLNLHINFSDDPDAVEYDSEVNVGFKEVELSKLGEQLESCRKNDWQKALSIIEMMIKRADEIGDRARRNDYESYRNKLKKDHQLSDADMNMIGSSSSQATSAAEGYLESEADMDILNSL